jgi:tetratricopeptide (TPR) repeat protein
MARYKSKAPASADPPGATSRPHAKGLPGKRLTGLKLWCARLALAMFIPGLLFVLLELALRVAGFGNPTSFLLPAEHAGKKVFVQNNRFGWRFFGPDQSTQPACLAIARAKPAGTVRLFVFGESAAFGDPQPDFGMPRLLQAMLSHRYPGTRFEAVNAAMTGINSHTILPIARDCAHAAGDIWILYMGNNEVVGPFGAGTVFGPQTPGLPLVRASLAVQTTRTGQLLDRVIRLLHAPPASKSEWGGMRMFLENRVRADDPRMPIVYQHFERNLTDILQVGRRAGAGIVVSTVAVNLKDCAPFASAHRPAPGGEEHSEWRQIYERGLQAQEAGRPLEAIRQFRVAEQLDDSAAELHFSWGTAALALGDTTEARRRFALARDLDTLRFRCDRTLNEIIRRVASAREPEHVALADAESAFALQSPGGLPGSELFYEHVHLTFEGNYLLARTLAEQVERLLPEEVRRSADLAKPWATADECARRLAWSDAARLSAAADVLGRLHDPPFTLQLNHDEQTRRYRQLIAQLQPGAQAAQQQAENLFREALAASPEDPVLNSQRATFLAAAGDAAGAAESARRVIQWLPHSAEAWGQLGDALVRQEKYAEAAEAFAEAFRRDPDSFWALQNLAQAHARLGRRDEAMGEFRRAIQLKPRFGPAWLGLGQLLEEAGRKAEAEEHFRKALTHRVYRAAELTTLARFCHGRGWFNEALTNYLDAIKLNPVDAQLHVGAGQCLAALGRQSEVRPHYAEAVRLAPGSAEACYLLGVEFGRQGMAAEAAEKFREAVRLAPELVEARLNLGVALLNQGQNSPALEQFEEVLRRSPTNAVALQHLQSLRSKAGPPRTP